MNVIGDCTDSQLNRSQLRPEHRRELERSGIRPDLIDGRYFSVTAEEARRLGFSASQAGPGWACEMVSPCGEIHYQIKHDTPRPDPKRPGKRIKYDTPAGRDIMLDARRILEASPLRSGPPTLITEGAKTGDSLASLGYSVVILTGVWNWGKRRSRGGVKYGRPQLLPGWGHLPLEGEKYVLLFDADYREKPGVALAMLRLGERLEERGARVYVAELPPGAGGADDYIAAGGDIDAVIRAARPFRASDLIPYASKPTAPVLGVLESVEARIARDDWTGRGDDTTHSLLRALVEEARLTGRYDSETGAVAVAIDNRTLQRRDAIGSHRTLENHVARLGDRGYGQKIPGDRGAGRANRYLLFAQSDPLMEGSGVNATESPVIGSHPAKFAPHLRWPAPARPGEGGDEPLPGEASDGSTRVNSYHERPLRVQQHRLRDAADLSAAELGGMLRGEGERPLASLGKRCERVLWLLLRWGGGATLADLAGAIGASDTSKLRRALAPLVGGGVLGVDPAYTRGARVWLEPEWERRLDALQEHAGDFARARTQAVKHRQSREAFEAEKRGENLSDQSDQGERQGERQGPEESREDWLRRLDRAAGCVGPERVEKSLARGRERERSKRTAREEARAGVFVAETLSKPHIRERGCIRLGLLKEMWTEEGAGRVLDLKRALRADGYRVIRHAEQGNALFVYPPADGLESIAMGLVL